MEQGDRRNRYRRSIEPEACRKPGRICGKFAARNSSAIAVNPLLRADKQLPGGDKDINGAIAWVDVRSRNKGC